jgi:DNA-binding beta-propeller fold protein YncE
LPPRLRVHKHEKLWHGDPGRTVKSPSWYDDLDFVLASEGSVPACLSYGSSFCHDGRYIYGVFWNWVGKVDPESVVDLPEYYMLASGYEFDHYKYDSGIVHLGGYLYAGFLQYLGTGAGAHGIVKLRTSDMGLAASQTWPLDINYRDNPTKVVTDGERIYLTSGRTYLADRRLRVRTLDQNLNVLYETGLLIAKSGIVGQRGGALTGTGYAYMVGMVLSPNTNNVIHKLRLSDLRLVEAVRLSTDYYDHVDYLVDDTYMYLAGYKGTDHGVFKIRLSDWTQVAQYLGGETPLTLAMDADYIYYALWPNGYPEVYVQKLKRSDLSSVSSYGEGLHGPEADRIIVGDGKLWIRSGAPDQNYLYKVDAGSMTLDAKVAWGSGIGGLYWDGTYLYAGDASDPPQVVKKDSDLNTVLTWTGEAGEGPADSITGDSNYIYVYLSGGNRIKKIDKATMTTVATFTPSGYNVGPVYMEGGFLYSFSTRAAKINPADMTEAIQGGGTGIETRCYGFLHLDGYLYVLVNGGNTNEANPYMPRIVRLKAPELTRDCICTVWLHQQTVDTGNLVYDAGTDHFYFLAHYGGKSYIIKLGPVATFSPETEWTSLQLSSAGGTGSMLWRMPLEEDPGTTYLYALLNASPPKLVRIDLTTFTEVASMELTGYSDMSGALQYHSYLYSGLYTDGKMAKFFVGH